MALAVLAAATVLLAAGFALGRLRDPGRAPTRILRLLFYAGAPAAGVVATSTSLDSRLGVGILAVWSALLVSLAAVLVATRGQPGTRRAETALAICWPNAAWMGAPAAVVVFGWGALPLAIAFSQLASGPFTQLVLPGVAGALVHERGGLAARARAFVVNPYLLACGAGYALAVLGDPLPSGIVGVARWYLVLATIPAFGAVGATLAVRALRPGPETFLLSVARLTVASVPLLLLRTVLPIPGAFVLLAAMSVGMQTFSVAAVYRVPTARLAPALALTTAAVLAALALVPLVEH